MYKQAKPYLQTMHNKSVQAHHKAQNTTKHYNRIICVTTRLTKLFHNEWCYINNCCLCGRFWSDRKWRRSASHVCYVERTGSDWRLVVCRHDLVELGEADGNYLPCELLLNLCHCIVSSALVCLKCIACEFIWLWDFEIHSLLKLGLDI